MNLIPHIFEDNSSTGYNEVWTFVINFDEAEKYRKLRGGFLRKKPMARFDCTCFCVKERGLGDRPL